MKIRTLSRSSGKLNFERGETLDLPDDEAKVLLDGGYAEPYEEANDLPKVVQTRGNKETGNTSTTISNAEQDDDGTASDDTSGKRSSESKRAKKSD